MRLKDCTVRLTIRRKLMLYTVLPVIAVYSLLFWLGVSHVRSHLSDDAQGLLVEHARHQASRLALVFSQIPVLAESLGDLVLAEPDQSQALLYAHLIDGLRRTPVAKLAALALEHPRQGGALMRRGAPSGLPLGPGEIRQRAPGWEVDGEILRFNRPIHHLGRHIGDSWVELQIADVYAEIERIRSKAVNLFVVHQNGTLLAPPRPTADIQTLLSLIPDDLADEQVLQVSHGPGNLDYWVVSANLPGFPWHITAVTPTESALAPARRQATLFALALMASLAAILGIIGMVTRQITRPLATLDASVQQVTQGNFAVAPQVSSDDELGRLAKAIGRMAGCIADREQQLRDSHQVLEQRVAERTSELQESNTRLVRLIDETRRTQEALRLAKEQAQEASRAKSEFLSNMSHELRTPLHGVLGYAQILRRDAATSDTQRESLDAIERCGQHLLTLINDILDLTKIEAGQMRVDIQPTELAQLLEDVRTIVAQRAAGKGLDLHLQLADDLPQRVLTDPVKLKQILLNLLGNAVKFTNQGAVTLSVDAGGTEQLQFSVTDTGVGIPSDNIHAIFDAFHQAREGQSTDGTGLGLTINQRLINLLGGQALEVESTPGVGSCFRFRIPCKTLPADEPSEANDAEPGRLRLAPGQVCTLMVVDALAENRNVLSTLLRYAGCEVEAFPDHTQAAQRLREKAFDLLLIDVRLLDARIADRVNELRDSALFGSPRMVAVSANVFPGAERSARQIGFDAFLAKPFDERQLLDRIAQLLGLRFEARPEDIQAPTRQEWPIPLAHKTASRIREAVDLGDVASLFQLAEELAATPDAPRTDIDNIALMARLFDFDGLRHLSERLQNAH